MVDFGKKPSNTGSSHTAPPAGQVIYVKGDSPDVAYEVTQALIRKRLREVQTVFENVKDKKPATVWTVGLQMGVMLCMDAVKDGRLDIR